MAARTLETRALRREMADGAVVMRRLMGASPAIEKLRELYQKRRAWPQLYALYERQLAGTEIEPRADGFVPEVVHPDDAAIFRATRGAEYDRRMSS